MAKGLFKPATPQQIALRPQDWEDQLNKVDDLRCIIESVYRIKFTDNEWIQLIRRYLVFEGIDFEDLTILNDDIAHFEFTIADMIE